MITQCHDFYHDINNEALFKLLATGHNNIVPIFDVLKEIWSLNDIESKISNSSSNSSTIIEWMNQTSRGSE